MPASLEHLVVVRSPLVKSVLTFLHRLAEVLDATPWVRRDGARIHASDIAVEPFVLTKEERPRTPQRERLDEAQEGAMPPRPPMEEIEAAHYELPVQAERFKQVRWREMIRRRRARLGVQGAPGSGKTFTTRHTVAESARHAAERLEQQDAGVEEIEAPIWVTAKALAQASARDVGEALLEALETSVSLTLSPPLRDWLQRAIDSSRAFIVVDALDELVPGDRAGFEANSRQFDQLKGRVMVTCRTMQWEERQNWLSWRTIVAVELMPLQRRQQREFGRKFFAAHPTLAQSMEHLLEANVALRHACATTLLLTFACLLHAEGKVNEGTAYAQLYAQMVRKMMLGEWRESGIRPPWASHTVQEECCLQLLESIGWGLFAAAPHQNRFTLVEWAQAARRAVDGNGSAPIRPTVFLKELERLGFIVPAGFDAQRGDRCWSVVHRTFLEFLAARALSRRPQRVWLTEANKHFWFQPEWLEVLTFLAGLVEDATPLIEAVAKEQKNDDLFGSMLSLNARLVGAATKVDAGVLRQVCNEVISAWESTLRGGRSYLREFAVAMFAPLTANVSAKSMAAERVLAWTSDEDPVVRRATAQALGAIGAERAVDQLLAVLQEEDAEEEDADWWAVRAVRLAAVQALGQIGAERAVDRLLALTRDADATVRAAAVQALGAIRAERAVDRLLALMKYGDDCAAAAQALGQIGAEWAVDGLLVLATIPDATIRKAVAQALGAIGATRAVEWLLAVLQYEDADVCRAAAQALWHIVWRNKLPIRARRSQ